MPHSFLLSAYDTSITTIPPTSRFDNATLLRDLKNQLRGAPVLLTCNTTGTLDVVPYPCDSEGVAVPVSELVMYNQTHTFVEEIHCFFSVSRGTPGVVRIFITTYQRSEHLGCVCVGCADWKPSSGDGASSQGCTFFVNISHHFAKSSLTADKIPLKAYPRHPSIVAPTPVRPTLLSLTPTVPFGLPPCAPITPPWGAARLLSPLGLFPGLLYDAKRLYSPPSPDKALTPVEDRSTWPSLIEAEQNILALINPLNPGTSYTKLVSSLGNCFLCSRVMALPLVLRHYCLPLPGERTSLARKGDKVDPMFLFGIGLPSPPSPTGVGSSAHTTVPLADELTINTGPNTTTPIKSEDANDSDTIDTSRHTHRRALIPADDKRMFQWVDRYYEELEALKPGLASAILNGTPRDIPGPLLFNGQGKLYIGSPRPSKCKSPAPLSESEEASDYDASGEDPDSSPTGKGKAVKRRRRLGEVSSEGKAGEGSADGHADDGGSADDLRAVKVKVESEAVEEPCPLIGREEPFTTQDGKQVTLIDLTDD